MPGDFELSTDDLRVVARYVVETAEALLPAFEDARPDDARPRAAVDAAWRFVNGEPRTTLQRVTSMAAHRAAADAPTEVARLAAQAAGDSASAAYLHPIAKAHQVGHILRAAANAARIAELTGGQYADVMDRETGSATTQLVGILRRYPPAPTGRSRVAELMSALDTALRDRSM